MLFIIVQEFCEYQIISNCEIFFAQNPKVSLNPADYIFSRSQCEHFQYKLQSIKFYVSPLSQICCVTCVTCLCVSCHLRYLSFKMVDQEHQHLKNKYLFVWLIHICFFPLAKAQSSQLLFLGRICPSTTTKQITNYNRIFKYESNLKKRRHPQPLSSGTQLEFQFLSNYMIGQ